VTAHGDIATPRHEPGTTARPSRSSLARLSSAPVADAPATWLTGFIAFQIACQLLLLVPGIDPVRMVLRTAAFGASLLLVFVLPREGQIHPATYPALAAVLICATNYSSYSNNDKDYPRDWEHRAIEVGIEALRSVIKKDRER
jgi:hypothetical protein